MRDSDKSNVVREVEIRILKSEKFPEGGGAYIVATCDSDGRSIEIKRADNREGSLALEMKLTIKLDEYEDNNTIGSYAMRNPSWCSRALTNLVFRTQLSPFSERQEETIEHPSFGTVLIKGLTFAKYRPDVEY